MSMKLYVGILSSLVLLSIVSPGCAGVDYRKATEAKTNGLRYYRPASYLLVKPDYEAKKAQVVLFHGPDTSTPYAASPYSWFAANNASLEFDKGMLTNVHSAADGTALPKSLIEAAVAVGKETLDAAAQAAALAAAAGAAARVAPADEAAPPPIFLFMATAEGARQIYPPPPQDAQPTQ
jgi:hypothetical protein